MNHYSREIKKHLHEKRTPAIVLLCSLIYLASYIARLSYASVMVEIIMSEGYDKTLVSLPLTTLAIAYGLGQIIFGYLGDKVSSIKLIFVGLLLSTAMNFSVPFVSFSVPIMTVVWTVNGLAQAMMWPPIVKILTTCLSPSAYHKYIVFVGWGSCLGTIAIYLLAPVAVATLSWKAVFFFSSGFVLFTAFLWITFARKAEEAAKKRYVTGTSVTSSAKEPFHGFAIALLIIIVALVALQGMLRDGIANWMPTYLTEVFKLESTVSILTGIALPVFSMFIMWFSIWIYRKLIKNESTCAAIFFALCGLSVGVLCVASSASSVLSVAMLTIGNAATHGINAMYTSLVVPNFARYGKTSFVTGLINSGSYLGSALSSFSVALISDHFGWGGTMVSWLIISVVGAVICLLTIPLLKRLKAVNRI